MAVDMNTVLQAVAIAQAYTDTEIAGGGAIKGKNCVIDSITEITGGHRVTFKWTLDNGTVQTGTMDVMDGHDGQDGQEGPQGQTGPAGADGADGTDGRGIKRSYVDEEEHFIIVYDDDTEEDCGKITVIGGDSSLTADVTSNLAVGAIASGTTLPEGTTFTEFAQKLLISEIAPTLTFSISKSGNVIYGGSYIETLTVDVTNLGSAKKIKSIAWYEGNTLKQTDTVNAGAGVYSYAMVTPTVDTTTFKAVITYVKSDDTEASITKTASINFYYNKFYGAVNSLTPDEATVEALTSALGTGKGGTYSFTVSDGRICYAYPKSLGDRKSVV